MKAALALPLMLVAISMVPANGQNGHTLLRLELIRTHPYPVIDSTHPDARDIRGGFETGNSMKLTINGETAYHMITTTMETKGDVRWNYQRMEHWTSRDGFNWQRHNIIFRPHYDPETSLWLLTSSQFPYFDQGENRWYIYHNSLALDTISNWAPPCLLKRVGAVERGYNGINGAFDFPGEIVAPGGYAYPTNAFSSSISTPFQTSDKRWFAFLGGGPVPLNRQSGRWWVCLVTAPGPGGPFKRLPGLSPVAVMDPTGYVENPLPMRLRGPETGREYWAIMFNYLKPEVTTGMNTEIGFSYSTDGVNWPEEHAQIIDVSSGLPPGEAPWWSLIRTPHQLIYEGDGKYTCFFTAYDSTNSFEGVGIMKFILVEEILP